jgi:hypothetical protein
MVVVGEVGGGDSAQDDVERPQRVFSDPLAPAVAENSVHRPTRLI